MLFILKDDKQRQDCVSYIMSLPVKPVNVVKIEENKNKRSLNQNDTFHLWASILAKDTGYSMAEIKDKLVLQLWPPIERKVKVKRGNAIDEYSLLERRSTKSLDTKEMSELMDATLVVAHTLGIILPLPEENNVRD